MPAPRVRLMVTKSVDNMDDERVSDNFKDSSEDDLIIHCSIVSVLPMEYYCISEVS